MLAPLALGIAWRDRAPELARATLPAVKRVTTIATALMLVGMVIVYGRATIGAIGSFAIFAQLVFCSLLMALAYGIGPGLTRSERSVMGLGMGTRNIGAALAPLAAVPAMDPRAIVMCAIALPVTIVVAAAGARLFGARTT